MKRGVAILALAAIVFFVSVACKTARLGPKYPVDDISVYDVIVIATVEKAIHSTQGYEGLESFELTIIQSLKGNLRVGERISGKAKSEEAHAVCPIRLMEEQDYLLLLTHPVEGYRLSRFSFPVAKDHQYFNDYIEQIKKMLHDK